MEDTRFHQEFCEIKYIGEGSYGTVFSCKHKLDRQVYAMKIIKFNKDDNQSKVLREVKALAKCNHKNVVRYFTAWIEWRMVQFYDSDDKDGGYDVNTDDDAPLKDPDSMLFIQMEHCCQNLDHLLEQSTISKGEALKYFREIVRGLDHIHGKKIIHGDLSRKNIFIDASNMIKVADFGLARLLENSATAIKSGSSGTKTYLAPEAETGATIDEKIDIYSLGILLLELLGRFTTMFERAHAITNLQKMRVLPESVRGYEDYILQLVALSPGERPSTREILTWPICADVSSSEAEDDDRVPIRTEDETRAADDDPPQEGDAADDPPQEGDAADDNPQEGEADDDNPQEGDAADDNPQEGEADDDNPQEGDAADDNPQEGDADDDNPQEGDADVPEMEDDDVPEVEDTAEQVLRIHFQGLDSNREFK